MAKFIVESDHAAEPPAGLSRKDSIDFMKSEVGKLVSLIEVYNQSAQDNRVTVENAAWLNTTVQIEATEEAAAKLAAATGLKVEKPRMLTRE